MVIIGTIMTILLLFTIIVSVLSYHRNTAMHTQKNKNLIPPDPVETQPPSWSELRTFKRGAVCADGVPCAVIGKYVGKSREVSNEI